MIASGTERRAIVLLSGGIDSAVTLAMAQRRGLVPFCLTIDYGQRHRREVKAARRIARFLGARQHLILSVDLRPIGGSALTSDEIAVTQSVRLRSAQTNSLRYQGRIPPTYVPARNTILLSLALAWAEVLQTADIFIGANVVDYSGYPDCRPEFLRCFERLCGLATKAGAEGRVRFRINAPLLKMSKSQIISAGMKLGVDFALTHSCYDPTLRGLACGRCDSCRLRLKGFADAGIRDPVRYAVRQSRN